MLLSISLCSSTQGGKSLAGEVRSLQQKLSDTGETAIKQSERLREVRAEKRTLDLEYSQLKIRLNKAEVHTARYRLGHSDAFLVCTKLLIFRAAHMYM